MQTEQQQKAYYAVIPADVRYSDITPNAKLLYGEITALCNEKGYCWASNEYFANLYGVSKTSVSLWIKQLSSKDFIEIELKDNYNRKIFLKGALKNLKGGFKKSYRGALKNLKDNNTMNNTMNNTDKLHKCKEDKSSPSWGNPFINQCIELLKEQIGSLDGSVRENRRFCHLLINKLKKDYPNKQPLEMIKALISFGIQDKWHGQHITNFKYLYYNSAKIILSVKEHHAGGVIKAY